MAESYAMDERKMLAGISAWRKERGTQRRTRRREFADCLPSGMLRAKLPVTAHQRRTWKTRTTTAIHPAKVGAILDMVAQQFALNVGDLLRVSNEHRVVRPRQVAMYLLRRHTDYSVLKIADFFGGMHHTTVLYAVERVEELRKTDVRLDANVAALSRLVVERFGGVV